MITSARDGDLLVLRRVLDQDPAAVHARGWMGETPLHAAAAAGSADAVRLLLAGGADPEARRENGDTPVHRAASGEIAELVLPADRGVTADPRNDLRQTPLHCAQDREVVVVLLRRGASTGALDFRGGTPLHDAGAAKARVLLNAGADIEARDDQGQTPLHRAVWNADPELVVFLLAEGADPGVRDRGGSSPIHLARRRGPEEIRTLVEAAGGSLTEPVDPAVVAGRPQSALRMARGIACTVSGHATLVRWRLDRPARPEVIVSTEHSAIHDVAVHPTRPLIAVAPAGAEVELRGDDLAGVEPLRGLADVTALAFSPDGRWLAAATDPERVVLVDLDSRQIVAEVEAGERTDCVSFSPDGSLLATTCSFQAGAHVRVDRVTAEGGLEPLTEVDRPCDTIPAAVFTPDSRQLLIWDTSAIGDERRPPGWRGNVLLTDIDGTMIWQRAIDAETTGEPAPLPPMGFFTEPCVTPDGEHAALGLDGTVVLLRISDGTPAAVLPIAGVANTTAVDPATGALVVATDRGLRRHLHGT